MDVAVNHSSCYKWSNDDFQQFCRRDNGSTKLSNLFTLYEDSSIKFGFSFVAGFERGDDKFGITITEFGNSKSVKVNLCFWVESQNSVRFGPCMATHEYYKPGDKYEFSIPIGKFTTEFNQRTGLTFCCEIKKINYIPNAHLSFRQRLWAEQQEGLESGVVLKVDGQEFKVGRDVLVCQSSVFKTMLQPIFKEGQSKEIHIEDFDANTVASFVKWLYLGEIDSDEIATELHALADKYLITDLKDQCLLILATSLNDTNVTQRLIWAVEKDAHSLRHSAVKYLADKKERGCMLLLQSRDWIKFAYEDEQKSNEIVLALNFKLDPPDGVSELLMDHDIFYMVKGCGLYPSWDLACRSDMLNVFLYRNVNGCLY